METFIGKPQVYTIDIDDFNLVESTIKEIVSRKVETCSMILARH